MLDDELPNSGEAEFRGCSGVCIVSTVSILIGPGKSAMKGLTFDSPSAIEEKTIAATGFMMLCLGTLIRAGGSHLDREKPDMIVT